MNDDKEKAKQEHPPQEPLVITVTKRAPTQPALLSDDEILNCFYASKSEGMRAYMLAIGRAIEAHCRGGANEQVN